MVLTSETYHTWSISSKDSNLAIGAKMFQFSVASSIGWLKEENFEHLQCKWESISGPTLSDYSAKLMCYLNKLFSFAHSGCETDLVTFRCGWLEAAAACACGCSDMGCLLLFSVVVLKLSNENSLSDGWYDVVMIGGFPPCCNCCWLLCIWWCWIWDCWCCMWSCICCCWCKRSKIVWMSFRSPISKLSRRDESS